LNQSIARSPQKYTGRKTGKRCHAPAWQAGGLFSGSRDRAHGLIPRSLKNFRRSRYRRFDAVTVSESVMQKILRYTQLKVQKNFVFDFLLH
jgi:hypothetical protein